MIKAALEAETIPLSGCHLIEASAGTGKTYNIIRLYIRLLIEKQLDVQNILVMTFTNAATEELRGRIDEALRSALSNWGSLGREDSFYAAMEAQYKPGEVIPLLHNALLHLDEASIFTIHGFCARVLKQHAFSSDIAMDVEMEADTTELALEALRDWFRSIGHSDDYRQLMAKGWHTPESFWDKFSRAIKTNTDLMAVSVDRLTRQWVQIKAEVKRSLLVQESLIFERLVNSHKQQNQRESEWVDLLAWLDATDFSEPPKAVMNFVNGNRYRGQVDLKTLFQPFKNLKEGANRATDRAAFCNTYQVAFQGIELVRKTFAVAKERQGVMDFDDLISVLAERMQCSSGEALAQQLQTQYPVALVDEFQDTDPQQYAILERLYSNADGQSALFMIGDPKQAIYSFRGADIFTYLQARRGADYTWHMDTNWRSVTDMVSGYNRLFWGASLSKAAREVFGYGIEYEQIKATPKASANQAPLKDPDSERKAMNYVWFVPQEGAGGSVNLDFKNVIARWCAGEIERLLNVPAHLGEEPLQEHDIAILVRTAADANVMQAALREAGYASVYLSARENLFNSEEADELVLVLRGILDCEDKKSLIAACSTRLVGGDAQTLAAMSNDPDLLVDARFKFLALRDQWNERGFISMMMTLVHSHLKPSVEQHERTLTNYLHLAELLQKVSGNLRHPQQILEWLEERKRLDAFDQEAELRLESDANLIRIVTQHGSKGLEYPIVFVPFACYGKDPVKFNNQEIEYYAYHDPVSYRPLQVIGKDSEVQEYYRKEGFAEAIRLLYVSVTRARHRCYLCAAPFKNSYDSPLARTLDITSNDLFPKQLEALAESDGIGFVEINEVNVGDVARRQEKVPSRTLKAAEFNGTVDRSWYLSSFSSLVRNVNHSRQGRREHADDQPRDRAIESESSLLRFRLIKGAHTGNLLHDALEHCDFSQPDWPLVLKDPLLQFGHLKEEDETALMEWLQACLETDLPAIPPAFSRPKLSRLNWSATLRESEFYFPLNGSYVAMLMQILQRHRNSEDPVDLPAYHRLNGMMHGFIDLVFEHQGRFYVADYKSTHLGNHFSDYDYQSLKSNNEANFYDLQYLIYCLALHRYLGSRMEHYDPERHFGGVYYLYLRGMQPGSESGVFHSAISPALLDTLDSLFSGSEVRSTGLSA